MILFDNFFAPKSSCLISYDEHVLAVPGDEFALHGDGIYCKDDHELFERCEDNNNLDTKTNQHIKNELDDFRDNMSDLGREDDSYR